VKRFDIKYAFRFILLLAVITIEIKATEPPSNIVSSFSKPIHLGNWQIAKDTELIYSLPTLPDTVWQLFEPTVDENRYIEGNWLIKTIIDIKDTLSGQEALGFFPINFVTAYDIYWDGIKIASNGRVGINNAEEKAGEYNFSIILSPNLITRGEHTIIIRLSNHHNYSSWKWFYGDMVIGKYDSLLKRIFQIYYQAFFITGILFIPFLFNLFLYFARNRKIEHLLFSLICFIVIFDSLTMLFPMLIETQTTFVYWQYYVYHVITVLFSILLPAFFIYLFSFPKHIIVGIAATNLFIYLFFTDVGNLFSIMPFTVLMISSMITLWALFKRQEESIIIFAGILGAWAAYYFNIAFAGLASTMVICTTFSIARQFARKENTEREAQLRSAHLENELLKKNINPHFLLNTLTSIIAWLRKDPKSAVKLIEALAEEFRMILQISGLKQIPIQQEIALCKTHLKIMSYRKGADYKIETVGIIEDESVPPMIIHTLIENGLTHGYENKIKGTFILQRNNIANGVQYLLSDDGDFVNADQKESTGFGMRYIKSRLEESYPNRWELTSHWLPGGWETIIEIKER
jgi:sensor histidine kinase YesM